MNLENSTLQLAAQSEREDYTRKMQAQFLEAVQRKIQTNCAFDLGLVYCTYIDSNLRIIPLITWASIPQSRSVIVLTNTFADQISSHAHNERPQFFTSFSPVQIYCQWSACILFFQLFEFSEMLHHRNMYILNIFKRSIYNFHQWTNTANRWCFANISINNCAGWCSVT